MVTARQIYSVGGGPGVFTSMTDSGYVVPGSRRKSMKGITATQNSPDVDTVAKLQGMRALSRDLSMNSALGVAILRRHKIHTIGSGLQVQSMVDRDFLKLSSDEATEAERNIEREFDLWAESPNADFDNVHWYGDLQALAYYNMLLSGDYFFMPVWRTAPEAGFPYEMCVKLIDADLVRDPLITSPVDVQGGVRHNARGQVDGYYVWSGYEYECSVSGVLKIPTCTFVPLYDSSGRQQIFHVFDPERIAQRRGVPLLAPVADPLKQLTRLSDAELMNALVSNFFTVFVRDQSGMGAMLGPSMTPEETVTGGGRYGPDQQEVGSRNPADGNDLEMGSGNIFYLDDKKDITVAEPTKTDSSFASFWDALATQVCAGANIPKEQALMHYTTSYTAARAAANDVWRYRMTARTLLTRKMNVPIYLEWMTEAALKGRLSVPGFFDDYGYRRAWSRSAWVGTGQGSLNPSADSTASQTLLDNHLTTHEEEFQTGSGGRWDAAMDKLAREKEHLNRLGLKDKARWAVEVAQEKATGDEPEEEGVQPLKEDKNAPV